MEKKKTYKGKALREEKQEGVIEIKEKKIRDSKLKQVRNENLNATALRQDKQFEKNSKGKKGIQRTLKKQWRLRKEREKQGQRTKRDKI